MEAQIIRLTKRLGATGVNQLRQLQDKGTERIVWRQLTAIANRQAPEDAFFTLREGVKPEHFKGILGFFRKLSESIKISYMRAMEKIAALAYQNTPLEHREKAWRILLGEE